MKKSNNTSILKAVILSVFFICSLSPVTIQFASAAEKDKSEAISPDFFPIFPCDPQHGYRAPFIQKRTWGLESIKECNYTMAGFVRPEDLPECEKLGLAAIMISGSGLIRAKEWGKFSDAKIDSIIKKMVDEAGSSKAVFGFHITDEPGASMFPQVAKAVAAVKKYAPGKLAYLNIYPNYATLGAKNLSQMETDSYSEYLERFVREVKPQFISYDNYMVEYSQDLQDSVKAASYYTNLMEVRALSLKYDLPFWNTVSSNQIRPTATIPSPANLRFQAYTTLAAGGKGVKWYTYYSRDAYGYAPIDKGDRKSQTWYYVKDVNREILTLAPILIGLKTTGVYFTAPLPVSSLPVLPGALIQSAESDAPLMIGEFDGPGGARYTMAVNLSLQKSAKVSLTARSSSDTLQLISAADGAPADLDSKTGFWLTAGQGALIRMK
ncbi:MAG: hypothetical protein Q8O92_15015 [Candidatus Latescibacter sp.]|nr:hypothetical protein [Candidatus Latescibacter sp.]